MTVLSAQTIRELMIMQPCHEKQKAFGMSYGLSACGYDLTLQLNEKLILAPQQYVLAVAAERFIMPDNVVGMVHDKSTWARCGLTVQNTVVEPNWRGYLTLELCNHSQMFIELEHGMPIAQVVFHFLDKPTELPYSGKYQDQPAKPVDAIFEDHNETH